MTGAQAGYTAGVRRSDPSKPGITRRRQGRGWRFLDPTGRPLSPEETERVRSLAIPPAWRDVWICPHPTGHIQAVGTDDAGRRQYLYHEQWRKQRDEAKHERVQELAVILPRFRAAVHDDLSSDGLTCRRVLGGALRMLDRGVFRTGGEEYAEENGSHGVATLLREHVVLRRGLLVFDYPAKSGLQRAVSLNDPELSALVRSLKRVRTGSDRLLAYREGRGQWRDLRSGEINDRFKELTAADYTVKDLRTWHATVVAAIGFARAEAATSQRARKRVDAAVMDMVADDLGNTRAIARKSYVDARVVEAFAEGRTIRATLDRTGDDLTDEATRQRIERAVLKLLDS
ncbi:DNA topoisomerase [Actinokineospora fastidiosa]|uniref:DNA topoisomerase n=1 Tax=Actinokineospora fastidiosa TaxID=1816 RepID=A0A918GD99_9PSEU|nr:DNA topoisomerase [Actinokineospora fastidiosa]